MRFWCAHVPVRNGIMKHSHRSIKTITARKNFPGLEAVYWYVTSKNSLSSSALPADVLHRYHIRVRNIDATPPPELQITGGRYKKGDMCGLRSLTVGTQSSSEPVSSRYGSMKHLIMLRIYALFEDHVPWMTNVTQKTVISQSTWTWVQ